MKALVTGGSGFLGARIARLLVERGIGVVVTYRPGDDTRGLAHLAVDHQPADLLDREALRRIMRGVDVVYHTAALVSFEPRRYDRQMEVNVEGTQRVLDAATEAGVARLVHTSTVNTLGRPAVGSLGDETTPFDWGHLHLGYMDSKRAAEERVNQWVQRGGDAVIVQPGTLFGPGDVNINGGRYLFAIAQYPVLVAMPGATTVAHVDDVAAGHLLAFEHGRRGERYLLGGEVMSYRALFELMAEVLDRPRPRLTLPPGLLLAIGRWGSRLQALLRRPLPVSEGLMEAACAYCAYSSRRAEDELGWTFRPPREAIEDAVAWYRAQGMLPR